MTDYLQSPQFRRKKRIVYAVVFSLLILWWVGKRIFPKLATHTTKTQSPITNPKKRDALDLSKKISAAIGTDWVNYSILVQDFSSDFRYGKNDTELFTAASVNKVPILAVLYDQAQKGKVDLDRVITVQESDIQDFGTGSIRYAGPGATYSIKTLAKLMIEQSDNTAAYILANQILGIDSITAQLTAWGLSQTDIAQNKTSNQDMARLFRMLYEEKITNHAYTQELFSFLKDTDFETRLPADLPQGVSVYHKIGTELRNIHDIGVVKDDAHAYYIGVFTSDITDESAADVKIAQISKIVYDFMQ